MNFDLQAALFRTYPRFFRRTRRIQSAGPIDFWGIQCGDGWFPLIDGLARQHEALIAQLIARGVAKRSWPRAIQIKEKLGVLRFSVRNRQRIPQALKQAIEAAEAASSAICESCGQPALMQVTEAWRHTACEKCRLNPRAPDDTNADAYLAGLRRLLASRST